MRLLIAAGGTGGHIYPALAVARSFRDRPDRPSAPDLVWVGGHRGLEAELVRDAGIRCRRLALRSLRTVDVSVHAVLDPIRLAASVPQAAAILAAERPAAILTFGGSQAVRRFNAAVAAALPRLVERVTVVHVTGESAYAAALTEREKLPADARGRYRPYPFLRDDMLAGLVATDLVVGRAGSSTLAEV